MPRYIDADALRKEFSNRPPDYYSTGYILGTIDEQPTVSPDEVRGVGEWSEGGYFDEMYGRSCVCSACGRDALGFPNYCPNCGAKMGVE